jgi:Tfp pilus assembly PilM family ATPase
MSLLARWLASPPPDAAIEISAEGVSVGVLGSRGAESVIQGSASAALAPGAVVPSLTSHNIVDRAAVAAALRTACDRLGQRPRRAALVIPDLAARVSLVRFDQVPPRREDLDQLIRWQVKKSSPFPADEACVTYAPGVRSGAAGEFVVVSARRETIQEYEGVCDAAGIYAGLVDLSTLCVVNLYLSAGSTPPDDWLVVHMRPDYTSIAIMRGPELVFFRNRAEGEAEGFEDVVHQTVMYYQDRLEGKGFARVFAGGTGRTAGAVDAARRDLEARVGTRVDAIDPTRAAASTERTSMTPDQLAALAPVVGMLLRTRREAVPA